MPAPAVIPAPIAYINVVAVKKLVVGSWGAAHLSALTVSMGGRASSYGIFASAIHLAEVFTVSAVFRLYCWCGLKLWLYLWVWL